MEYPEVLLEDGGDEGQSRCDWGHAGPFHKKKLEGGMNRHGAQGRPGLESRQVGVGARGR